VQRSSNLGRSQPARRSVRLQRLSLPSAYVGRAPPIKDPAFPVKLIGLTINAARLGGISRSERGIREPKPSQSPSRRLHVQMDPLTITGPPYSFRTALPCPAPLIIKALDNQYTAWPSVKQSGRPVPEYHQSLPGGGVAEWSGARRQTGSKVTAQSVRMISENANV
jgi:hypothetical protein